MTIEEMVETFIDGDGLQDVKAGLLAVIEKHVGPMVAEAFHTGRTYRPTHCRITRRNANDYAARIIAQLKGTQ